MYFLTGAGVKHTSNAFYAPDLSIQRNMRPEEACFIFPLLLKDAANKVTSYIKYCKGKVDSVPESGNYTGRSLRRGGLQEILIRVGSKAAGIFRGGWWNYD